MSTLSQTKTLLENYAVAVEGHLAEVLRHRNRAATAYDDALIDGADVDQLFDEAFYATKDASDELDLLDDDSQDASQTYT